jgi:hypothetical protein
VDTELHRLFKKVQRKRKGLDGFVPAAKPADCITPYSVKVKLEGDATVKP